MSERMLRVVCCAPATGQGSSPNMAASVRGCPWDSLLLCLLMHLEFSQRPCHSALWPRTGLNEALSSLGVGEPDLP